MSKIQPHCENCGREIETGFIGGDTDADGYTNCCNELVCYGGPMIHRFGNDHDSIQACCWAKARVAFKKAGRPVPRGSYRIH